MKDSFRTDIVKKRNWQGLDSALNISLVALKRVWVQDDIDDWRWRKAYDPFSGLYLPKDYVHSPDFC